MGLIPSLNMVVIDIFTLASASLDSVTKLFEQVKAVKELNLGRREMFKMLVQSIPSASHEGKTLNEKPGDDGNDSDGESDIVDFEASMSENWKKVCYVSHFFIYSFNFRLAANTQLIIFNFNK